MAFLTINHDNAQPGLGLAARLRRLLVVAVASIVAMSSASSASASCGNYLYRNGRPVSTHSMPVHSVNTNSADSNVSENPPVEVPVHRCSGPNCSNSPVPMAPLPAAPSNEIRGFDQAAILESLVKTETTQAAQNRPESERGARFEPSSIFRPPAV